MEREHFNNPKLTHFKALQMYMELIREIPEVIEVRLSEDDNVHTIISGPWDDDDICYQVSSIETAVMRKVKNQPFLFQLVNTQRIPQEEKEEQLHSFGELVWKR